MFCAHCGKEIADGAVVCVHCGVAVNNFQTSSSAQPTQPKKLNVPGTVGFIIGVGSIFFSAFAFVLGMFFNAIIIFAHTWLISILACISLPIAGMVLSIIGLAKSKKYNSANGLAIAGLIVSIFSLLLWGSVCVSFVIDVGFILR